MKSYVKTILLCIMAEVLNYIFGYISTDVVHFPLFMDTIFTVAITFYCGLIPGLCVAIFYNIFCTLTLVAQGYPFEPYTMLFSLCGMAVALVTWLFARKKSEFQISTSITILYLVLIALISSFCSIVIGGTVDYVRYTMINLPDRMAPIKEFTDSFVSQHFSLLASCYLAQIPVSIIDRLVTTFLGFGVYKMMTKLFGEESWSSK